MSARQTFSRRNLLLLGGLWLAAILTAPTSADTTVPQYDANGNLKSRTTSRGTSSYTYDASDRLKTEFGPGVNQAFGYDGNGNRQNDGSNTYTIAPNSNHIQTVNGITQVYDPAGNLLNDGQGKTFTYNAAGRLKEVRVNAVLVATYKYNYRGLRTHKITPQGTTLYHYDPQGHLIQTTDLSGAPKQTLHWADDQPIAQVDHSQTPAQLVYLHTDALNTPRSATDANRKIVWRWEGGAFGDTPPEENPDGDGKVTKIDLRFAGQYFDAETGLHYNMARYYDPKIGRYITSDPIGLRGGLNTYAYVSNNPLRWIDPSGTYISTWHYLYTLTGGLNAGLSFNDASDLADMVVDVDKGTQKVWQAHMHAMCAAGLTREICEKNFQNYVTYELNKCTKKGLARAIHAWHDSFPKGHGPFTTYSGMRDLVINHPEHASQDSVPSKSEQIGVPIFTQGIIETWRSECQCKAK